MDACLYCLTFSFKFSQFSIKKEEGESVTVGPCQLESKTWNIYHIQTHLWTWCMIHWTSIWFVLFWKRGDKYYYPPGSINFLSTYLVAQEHLAKEVPVKSIALPVTHLNHYWKLNRSTVTTSISLTLNSFTCIYKYIRLLKMNKKSASMQDHLTFSV